MFLSRLAIRVEKPLALVANIVLLAAVAILIVAVFPQLTEVFTLNTAAAITTANFPWLQFGAVIILYLLIGAIMCIPYLKWMQQRAAALQATSHQD